MDSTFRLVLYLVLFFICLALSAFFSSSETAFIGVQRIRVQHLVNKNVKGAKLVAELIKHPEKLLSTILLGNDFVNTAAASLGTLIAVSIWGEAGVLIATIAVTAILLVFGDTNPKVLAAQHPEGIALRFARPIKILSTIFVPFVIVLSWIASIFSRMVGGKPIPRSLVGEEEIRTMISVGHQEGTVEEEEAEMLHKVFEFGDRPVRDVMIPRPNVVWVEKGSKLADFLALYAESPLSRFPVYEENRDNVVGILSIKDVLMAQAKGTITMESPIDDLVRPAYFAPESKHINELFTEMRDRNYHLCIVVNEYGGTAGVVSLDMLVEEIVGPMRDELAARSKEYEIINDSTFQIDGSMRIDEANEQLGLNIPEGDYETVAGFVLDLLGRIPRENEHLRYKNMNIVISEMDGRKVERILLTKEKPADAQAMHPGLL